MKPYIKQKVAIPILLVISVSLFYLVPPSQIFPDPILAVGYIILGISTYIVAYRRYIDNSSIDSLSISFVGIGAAMTIMGIGTFVSNSEQVLYIIVFGLLCLTAISVMYNQFTLDLSVVEDQ